MKKLIMASASALALMAAATSASAQSVPKQTLTQAGNGNVANVTQSASNVISNVTQTGGGNLAKVEQNGASSGANSTVTINQYSAPSATAVVPPNPLPETPIKGRLPTAASDGNFAVATQAGGADNQITIKQGEFSSTGTLITARNSNYANVDQRTGGGNTANVTQNAADAFARTSQDGSNNMSEITQEDVLGSPGNDPSAVVRQNGQENDSDVTQRTLNDATGYLNVDVDQSGNSGYSRIAQEASGDNANNLSATVTQSAGSTGARSEIDQTASGDDTNTLIATVTQSGSFDSSKDQGSKITQDALSAGSTNLVATVIQNGGAKSDITQSISALRVSGGPRVTRGGDYVTAKVTQDAGNTSTVTQTMDGPVNAISANNFRATVLQEGGTENDANIKQEDTGTGANDQLDALIDQSGNRNEAKIEQTGAGSRRAAAGVPLSDATIIQSGNDNTGSIKQNYDGVPDTGFTGKNRASLRQTGDWNNGELVQNGYRSEIRVTQAGDGTAADTSKVFVNQLEGAHAALALVVQGHTSKNGYVLINQTGDLESDGSGVSNDKNAVNVTQRGDTNHAEVQQAGEDNYAVVVQSGDDTTSLIYQNAGIGSTADVFQSANNAWSSVTQAGVGGHRATVSQGTGRPD